MRWSFGRSLGRSWVAAASYVAHRPAARPHDEDYEWLGERLYSDGYQTWCRVVDGKLVCHPTRTWLTARANAA
jgi:feruloyl esterase